MALPYNLTVCASPHDNCNCVYSNDFDIGSFVCIGNFIYRVIPCEIPTGLIGINSIQRKSIGLVIDGPVEVWKYSGPMHESKILSVSVKCVKDSGRNISLENIANRIRLMYIQFILTFGQTLVMDDRYIIVVKHTDRGFISMNTSVMASWE